MRRTVNRTGLLVGLLGAVLGANGAAAQPPTAAAAQGTLRYVMTPGVLEDVNPSDVLAASTIWARGLGRAVGAWSDAQASLAPDVTALARLVSDGAADCAVLTTMEYLSIERTLQADPALVHVTGDGPGTEYVLVAPVGISSVKALAGKRVAVLSTSRQTPQELWLRVLALEAGLGENAVQVQIVTKPSQAVLGAFFGQVDATLVPASAFDTAADLNPQVKRTLAVIARSPRLLASVICVSRTMDPELRARWLAKAITMHQDPHFRQTFIILRMDRVISWDPHYLDTVRALLKRYEALKRPAPGR